MIKKLRYQWQLMQASFWFLPALMVVDAVVLAVLLITLDMNVDLHLAARWPLLFGAGAAGARGLLTTVASSMITVAGVVFSITLVALSLNSSQYSSRVIRTFMRDCVNQWVLGVFLGIFAYCLVVLRTIRGNDEGAFVPALAVLTGLLLAFIGIAVLIHFIHHIATSIQASSIIATAARETLASVDHLTAILTRLASRRIAAPYWRDQGVLRVIACGPSVERLLSEGFDQIRQNAEGNVAVLLRLLGALHTISGATLSPRRRRVLERKVDEIARVAQRSIRSPTDRDRLANRLTALREALVSGPMSFIEQLPRLVHSDRPYVTVSQGLAIVTTQLARVLNGVAAFLAVRYGTDEATHRAEQWEGAPLWLIARVLSDSKIARLRDDLKDQVADKVSAQSEQARQGLEGQISARVEQDIANLSAINQLW